ncbi:MAG: MFS transporter [Blastocatellia bacterium]
MAIPQVSLEIEAVARPTRVRYWVIVFAVTLAIVTYIDRVCISQAGPSIARDLGLSAITMGYVYAAFAWGYALFEIPGGYLGDRMGVRRVLMRVVVWWSFFTAATGWVWNSLSLIVTRFLFGAGEAGCFPNLTKAFTVWLPREERERAQGIMWMSARFAVRELAPRVRDLRSDRRRVGGRVLLLVPRQPARQSQAELRRARAAARCG